MGAPVVKREFLSKGFLVQQMTAGSKAFLFRYCWISVGGV